MWPDEEYTHSKFVFTLFKQVEPSDFLISNSAWPVEEAIAAAINKDLFFFLISSLKSRKTQSLLQDKIVTREQDIMRSMAHEESREVVDSQQQR